MVSIAHPRIGLPTAGSALVTALLVVVVVVVAALYFARDVLVPIALAVLLSFLLAPAVRLLRSWHLPRSVGVLVSVFIAFAVIFSLEH